MTADDHQEDVHVTAYQCGFECWNCIPSSQIWMQNIIFTLSSFVTNTNLSSTESIICSLKKPPPYLCPAVMVTFSCGMGMDATLEAVNILVSDSWIEENKNYICSVLNWKTGFWSRFKYSHPHSSPPCPTLPWQFSKHLLHRHSAHLQWKTGEQILYKIVQAVKTHQGRSQTCEDSLFPLHL